MGVGKFCTAFTFSGEAATPFSDSTNPKYCTCGCARTTNQVIRTSSLTRLGEIQHTALGDTTTKRRTRPDHRVTTHDVKSHLHSHPTWLLEEKRKKNFITITTFLRTIPNMNILCFILYPQPWYGRHCRKEECARGNTKDSQ